MSRPLLITDCDEVLLHMVGHFAEWLEETQGIHFALDKPGFQDALTFKDSGKPVPAERHWPLLDLFFDTEMHRQNVVPGAIAALGRIGEIADIVILTNIGEQYETSRLRQLETFDIRHRVLCNRGGKGRPVRELIDEMKPSVTAFVDDLAVHHASVAAEAPQVWRLHMIAEPRLAAHSPPAPEAQARIDTWPEAAEWIIGRLAAGTPAPR